MPPWLAQLRRIMAALVDNQLLAPEDAAVWLAALNTSAASRWDGGATSIESALGMPAKWRSIKRQIDQADVIAMCVGAGYPCAARALVRGVARPRRWRSAAIIVHAAAFRIHHAEAL